MCLVLTAQANPLTAALPALRAGVALMAGPIQRDRAGVAGKRSWSGIGLVVRLHRKTSQVDLLRRFASHHSFFGRDLSSRNSFSFHIQSLTCTSRALDGQVPGDSDRPALRDQSGGQHLAGAHQGRYTQAHARTAPSTLASYPRGSVHRTVSLVYSALGSPIIVLAEVYADRGRQTSS
jgi:hypothetical protein